MEKLELETREGNGKQVLSHCIHRIYLNVSQDWLNVSQGWRQLVNVVSQDIPPFLGRSFLLSVSYHGEVGVARNF